MFSKQILAVALVGAAFVSANPIIGGPGPVVTVSLCDSSNSCQTSALQENSCIEVPAALNNDVSKFTVNGIINNSFVVTCTLYDGSGCDTSTESTEVTSPGGDITESGMSDKVSSYYCVRDN